MTIKATYSGTIGIRAQIHTTNLIPNPQDMSTTHSMTSANSLIQRFSPNLQVSYSVKQPFTKMTDFLSLEVNGCEHEDRNLCKDECLPFFSPPGFNLVSWCIESKVPRSRINEYFLGSLVMHYSRRIALCIHLRTTLGHWILTVHISFGTKDRLIMASKNYYSSIATS